jgi:hypothetical protein
MSETAISICAAALGLIGVEPITSFDEGTPAAAACARLYPGLRDSLLTVHTWNFAMTAVQLARRADVPTGWQAAYTMPADLLTPMGFFPDASLRHPITRFSWQNEAVVLDQPAAWCVYLRRVPEGAWRPPFALLMRYALAAELAMPLTEKPGVAEYWKAEAFGTPIENRRGGQFRVAASADARESPPLVLPPGGMFLARQGMSWPWRSA